MTDDEKLKLFLHNVKNNKRWYIESFLKIRNKEANIVPLVLNRGQRYVMDIVEQDIRDNRPMRYIVLKARQMGISTLFEALIFHDEATSENKSSLIIAHEESASQNLFQMSKLFFENLPDEIRPMKKYSNGKVLLFENPENDEGKKVVNPGLRSRITIATAGNGDAGRSATIHNLHVSEVAFFPDAKTTMLGLLQCVPGASNTMVVLESTANGVGDWFHNQVLRAERGEGSFKLIFLPWFIDETYSHPFPTSAAREQFVAEVDAVFSDNNSTSHHTYEYDLMQKHNLTYEQLYWRKHAIENSCGGDEQLFMQEYPATVEEAFISSGRPKFSITALKEYQTITKPPVMRGYLCEDGAGHVSLLKDDRGYVSIWKLPSSDENYVIGADVAEGLALGDYSCGVVGNNETFDIDAMWHGHIDPDLFGNELVKLGKFYNNALIGVESNNHGLTTLSTIKKSEYWNLYFSKVFDKVNDVVTKKLGWTTTSRTKPLMIDKLAEFIREKLLGIYSDLVISEAFTYVIDDKGKTNAQSGCYDDTVMAVAIMLQLLLEDRGEFYLPEAPVEQRKYKPTDILDPLFESSANCAEVSM
jgi:hypothetical protein